MNLTVCLCGVDTPAPCQRQLPRSYPPRVKRSQTSRACWRGFRPRANSCRTWPRFSRAAAPTPAVVGKNL